MGPTRPTATPAAVWPATTAAVTVAVVPMVVVPMVAVPTVVVRATAAAARSRRRAKPRPPKDFATDFIDHYLHKGGYTGGKKSDPIVDTKTDYDVSVEYPAVGGAPASVLYIAVKQRHKNFFAIVYQTRPDEYPVLKPTFQASAGTLLVKPPS
jgi:hypothetical protein